MTLKGRIAFLGRTSSIWDRFDKGSISSPKKRDTKRTGFTFVFFGGG